MGNSKEKVNRRRWAMEYKQALFAIAICYTVEKAYWGPAWNSHERGYLCSY